MSSHTALSDAANPGLPWGPAAVPENRATGHFLAVGTTGSGKSLLQRRLMATVLPGIQPGTDRRALIFDAKSDSAAFLRRINVQCPVITMNPFESRSEFPRSVAWDVAADITSPARAQNLGVVLLPSERGGNNQYFTDAARQVVTSVIESFIRHTPAAWTFSDLVNATLSQDCVKSILMRDSQGRAVLRSFFGDDRTAYQVFTTICSRMAYLKPVAALWQRTATKVSLRQWLKSESILLLGANATARSAVHAINEIVFRVLSEEIDEQTNSASRRTWIWIDEARLAGPLLQNEMLPYLAVKGRSRGVALLLSFQDICGFREAAGPRIANEIVAQCSHKALLRMESEESAAWASRLLGQCETIESFRTHTLEVRQGRGTLAEQRVQKDAVLPSEFFLIPPTNKSNGLTGYFVSPDFGAFQGTVGPSSLERVVVPEHSELEDGFVPRCESEQWLAEWTEDDLIRLAIEHEPRPAVRSLRIRKAQNRPVFTECEDGSEIHLEKESLRSCG